MERTMIAWNFPNIVTIVLMAGLGWALFGVVAQLLKQQRSGSMG